MTCIVIDGGTSNTRIRLADQQECVDEIKLSFGIRHAAMEGSNHTLKEKIIKAMGSLLTKHNLSERDIEYVIISGMLTSNMGLIEVPHVEAPASLKDFASHIKVEDLRGWTCLYVPGMKTGNAGELDQFDVMRGEEVEAFGIMDQPGPGLVILPGSHTKFVWVDESARLERSYTTLAGELLKAVQSQTILANSVQEGLIQSLDEEWVDLGYEAAEKYGLTRALFQIRLRHLETDTTPNQRANFLAGVLFHEDVKALAQQRSDENWILVGGSEPLRSLWIHLLRKLDLKGIAADSELATFRGALRLAKVFKEERSNENTQL